MPIAYNIVKETENGKPLKIERKKDKKLVKGWKVDWLDAKGGVHHDTIEVYIRGQNKGKPKGTLRGAMTKDFKKKAIDYKAALDMVNKNRARNAGLREYSDYVRAEVRGASRKRVRYSARKVKDTSAKRYAGNAYKIAKDAYDYFNDNFDDAYEAERREHAESQRARKK